MVTRELKKVIDVSWFWELGRFVQLHAKEIVFNIASNWSDTDEADILEALTNATTNIQLRYGLK